MQPRLEVRGVAELERALANIERKVRQKIVLDALKKAAEPIVEEAKRRAPRLSGRGAEAIRSRVKERKETRLTVAIGPRPGRADGFYLRFIEFGTTHRVTKKKQYRGRITKRPFMRPALDARKAEAVSIAREEIRKGLEQVARESGS